MCATIGSPRWRELRRAVAHQAISGCRALSPRLSQTLSRAEQPKISEKNRHGPTVSERGAECLKQVFCRRFPRVDAAIGVQRFNR
jgi:hypothetical protein